MNNFILILSLALLISCRQKDNNINLINTNKVESVTKDTTDLKITFYKVNGKAILVDDNIKLLDKNFKEIKDISYLNEQFVEL